MTLRHGFAQVADRDPDFATNMSALLRSRRGQVFVATSWAEARRLEDEGVTAEMLVVDPWFR
jgi:hypothetical protein